jgi:nicotinate-nucleotide adenylyltransferase
MSSRRSGAPRLPRGGEGLRLDFALSPGMRVGLFGGSFDPPHAGHLQVARTARRRLGLDRVIWLVAPGNPLKQDPGALAERVALTRALASGAAISAAEARIGARFTIDTVRMLKARYPALRFVWIMGADSFADLHRWRDWRGIMAELPVAVVARPAASLAALTGLAARRFAAARLPERAARRLACAKPPAWIYLSAPWNFASSTALRQSSASTLD